MFAFLALAGDFGGTVSPAIVGKFSGTGRRQSESRTADRHILSDPSGSLFTCFEPKDEKCHPEITGWQNFKKRFILYAQFGDAKCLPSIFS